MSVAVHDLSDAGALGRVHDLAAAALDRYGCGGAAIELLNLSENATYLVRPDDGTRLVLRVHRMGYHDRTEIESELAWLGALRREEGVRTPEVRATIDGYSVLDLSEVGSPEQRFAVMFGYVEGREPGEQDGDGFETLGRITARMHRHARMWVPPRHFRRFAWDFDAAFGVTSRWGRWRDGVSVGPAEAALLQQLADRIEGRLRAFGAGPERFGLIHADTRLANLLVDDAGEVTVIDFDDCGYGWYLYDLGTAMSFFEDAPQVPELIDRWLAGYRSVATLQPDDEAEVWTFIMFRRLLLLAWIGSHQAVDIARQLGPSYTAGTCELADRYLSTLTR